ncbi:MAG: hypothetical protein JW803_07040 [Endomicrobiales bacterium]|nr:hypothetical protein [Endomicrobiales bacterium]
MELTLVRTLIYSLLLLLGVLMGLIITKIKITTQIAVTGAILFAILAFMSPFYGIIILAFSMLLSPEVQLANLPGRVVAVRIDDFLIVTLFLVWFANMAIKKDIGLFRKTPINLQISLFTVICVVFTVKGILQGYVSPVKSSFYVLKYIEYFFLYIMTANIVRDRDQVRKLLIACFITMILVCLHGYFLIGRVDRLYAPFDINPVSGTGGEPASLGGYMLIVIAVLLSLFVYAPSQQLRFLFIGSFVFVLPIFLYTFSRSSFLGFIPLCAAILLFAKRNRVNLGLILGIGLLLSPVLFPRQVDKVVQKFEEQLEFREQYGSEFATAAFKKGSSGRLRVLSWKKTYTEWLPKEPFTGFGITGVGIVDAQIPLFLGEIGLLGTMAFLWLIWSIGKNAFRLHKESDDWLTKGLSLGLMASVIGLLVQSLAVNTFVIIRIMEPFWFLTAIVVGVLSQQGTEDNTASQNALA